MTSARAIGWLNEMLYYLVSAATFDPIGLEKKLNGFTGTCYRACNFVMTLPVRQPGVGVRATAVGEQASSARGTGVLLPI
jgi:hypothetical protein